jgi:hypothetical protein
LEREIAEESREREEKLIKLIAELTVLELEIPIDKDKHGKKYWEA